MEVITVEKEKTKIYNNYIENVVRYSGDPKLDTVFTKDSIDFYQRVQSGWMFKK
ncbi:MAG: hypothetical protein IPP69_17585 [Flavobacteriales bacterium]|nr:hypothetical protein [Flavobacteriales bacterium]